MAELSWDGLRALVVDADAPIRPTVRTLLELEGWTVRPARKPRPA